MKSGRSGKFAVVFVTLLILSVCQLAHAQGLRFGNHREVAVPDYANIRIGPFYSSAAFVLKYGYRWAESDGEGSEFLFNNRRGRIRKDGSEFPFIAGLNLRNYLIISRTTDLDMSMRFNYEYYPMNTQDNEFRFDIADEGVFGNFAFGFELTPFIKGRIRDDITYKTDYVDTRGYEDYSSGGKYEYFENKAGVDLDWLFARGKNLGFSLSHTYLNPLSGNYDDVGRTELTESVLYEQSFLSGIILGARANYTQIDYFEDSRSDADFKEYLAYFRFRKGVGDQDGAAIKLTEQSELTVGIGYAAGIVYDADVRRSEGDRSSNTESRNEAGDRESVVGFATFKTELRKDLNHSLYYKKEFRSSFYSAWELADTLGYRMNFYGDFINASFFTEKSTVEPSIGDDYRYTTVKSGLEAECELTKVITVTGSSVYTKRENDSGGSNLDEAEWANDYGVWSHRIGTSFGITKRTKFLTQYQRTERVSDSSDLDYSRDIFLAMFTYTYGF